MSAATRRFCLIDPLTLSSRELLRLIEEGEQALPEFSFFHTSLEDEHEISEIGGTPALAPPLDRDADLDGCDVIILGSELDSSRLEYVESHLRDNPGTALVDMSRLERFVPFAEPAVGPPRDAACPRRVRVAHPALVAARILLASLQHFEVTAITLLAVEPVSALGREAIELVARQATQRLQGMTVKEHIREQILAFNLVTLPGGTFAEDAAQVFAGVPTAATRSLSGCFHGHFVQVGVTLRHELEEGELVDEWQNDPRVVVCEPMALDGVLNSDQVLVTAPSVGFDRRTVAFQAAVDGLRLGGARTALEILECLE